MAPAASEIAHLLEDKLAERAAARYDAQFSWIGETSPALLVIDIRRWFFRTPERAARLAALIEAANELMA